MKLTEEQKSIIKEYLKCKVINCRTEYEAKDCIDWLCKIGFRWEYGNLYTCWEFYKEETCYNTDCGYISYCYTDYFAYKTVITYNEFKQFIYKTIMETKELKIQVPEGYEIDKENSTFECVKFKKIKNTIRYEDIEHKLANAWDSRSVISVASSDKQASKVIAINKLLNVAKYLNGEWKPNWKENSRKYYIKYSDINNEFYVECSLSIHSSVSYFKSEELARQAIEILGEETIKTALSTDW